MISASFSKILIMVVAQFLFDGRVKNKKKTKDKKRRAPPFSSAFSATRALLLATLSLHRVDSSLIFAMGEKKEEQRSWKGRARGAVDPGLEELKETVFFSFFFSAGKKRKRKKASSPLPPYPQVHARSRCPLRSQSTRGRLATLSTYRDGRAAGSGERHVDFF